MGLDAGQREGWKEQGFFVIPGFAPAGTCESMLDAAVALAREGPGFASGGALVMPEARENPAARTPEDRVSKVFKPVTGSV